MNKEDKIKELFAEKLGAHEAPVNPELWNAIASQLGTAATVTSTGLSVAAKIIIGITAASVIGAGVYFISRDTVSSTEREEVKHSRLTEQTVEREEQQFNNQQIESVTNERTAGSVRAQDNANTVSPSSPATANPTATQKQLEETQSEIPNRGAEPVRTKEIPTTFRNEPSPNLIGEKPAGARVVVTEKKVPVKTDKQQGLDEHVVLVERKQEEQKQTFEITKLPNIYVLNASGYFSIGHKGEYSDFQFTIMDNKNNVVFRSDNPDFEWRGTDLYGNTIEPGNYIYIITVKDQNGKAINKYSALTVINQ